MIKKQLLVRDRACRRSSWGGRYRPPRRFPHLPARRRRTTTFRDAEVVVTGSLIRGTPEDAALPVDVIGADELAKQGQPSAVELLKALPTSNGVLGDSNQFDSRSQGAEGIATVNLRGLSPQRTLVLLNSKRHGARRQRHSRGRHQHDPAGRDRPDRSAEGRRRRDLRLGRDRGRRQLHHPHQPERLSGQRATTSSSRSSKGDWDVSASYGYNGERLHVLVAGGYQYRGELLVRDRDFAIRPYAENPQGGFTGGGNPADFLGLGPTGAPNTGITVDSSCAALGGVPTTPTAAGVPQRCTNNYTQFDSLTDTEKRYQAFVQVGIDLTSSLKLDVTALYGRSTVPHYRTSPSYLLTQSPSSATGHQPERLLRARTTIRG